MDDKKETLQLLDSLISIQSVSSDPNRFSEIKKAVSLLQNTLTEMGFTVDVVEDVDVPPLIVASRIENDAYETVGLYAHYDVQPEDPVDEWESSPFKLLHKDGKMIARGVADDKGPLVQIITALKRTINDLRLKKNIILLFEGEEEEGSPHVSKLIERKRDVISLADYFIILDSEMFAKNVPSITYALRGLVYFQIDISVSDRDLHSGTYGNMVHNPASILAHIFNSIKDIQTGKILIPGFYEDVRDLPKEEMEILEKTTIPIKRLIEESGIYSPLTTNGYHPSLSPKIAPSFDINGIVSGYTGEGSKTVISKSASAKFSFRLVETQDPDRIEHLVKSHIRSLIPEGVEYRLIIHSKSPPFYTDIHGKEMNKVTSALRSTFGNYPVFDRMGASIPVTEVIQRLFNKPVIVTGFVLPDCHMHSPNENFDVEMFWKGIEALELILMQ